MQTRGDESDLVKMIQRVIEFNLGFPQDKRITISLEFEKYREAVLELMPLADVVSKHQLELKHAVIMTS